jgi:site-specific DNA-cytosine methylase
MRILIACEQFGKVRTAFRNNGHDAWSCDIAETRDESPFHIQDDVINHLTGWDMVIGFPPCTYLTNAGNSSWYSSDCPEKLERERLQMEAIEFVKVIYNSCDRVCIENPAGALSTKWKSPTQIINPYQFGHKWKKRTCLWLKGLPELKTTNWVGSVHPSWKIAHNDPMFRSETFQGIADAMADQWG